MKKHILIPTDFSKNAWNALNYATALYKDEECRFFLLNAFLLVHYTTDSIIEPEPGEKAYEQARKDSELGLEKLIDGLEIRQENPGHSFEIISVYGSVLDAVKETVNKKDISIIIMGTKGKGNPLDVIYGSNAVNVMEKIKNCPVIVIPENTLLPEEYIQELVFATNFKHYYKRSELSPLIDIARRFNAAIRILYIANGNKLNADQETNKEALKDYLEGFVLSFHTLTHTSVAAGIHTFIESRNSDMLALYNRKHNFFQGLFSKNLLKEVGYKPDIPLLVLQSYN